MNRDNTGFLQRCVVMPVALATGVATGACREYTCLDTATCNPSNVDAGDGLTIPVEAGELRSSAPTSDGAVEQPGRSDDLLGSHDSATATGWGVDAGVASHPSDETTRAASSDGGAKGSYADAAGWSTSAIGASTEVSEAGDSTAPDETIDIVPTVRCDPAKPFGRPFAIDAINLDGVAENLMVSPNGLTAYIRYGSDPTTYVSTRDDQANDFRAPVSYSGFDALLVDNELLELEAILADGLTVYLSEGVSGVTPIRSSHREASSNGFSQLIVHEELADEGLPLLDPWLSIDGQRLYAFVPFTYTLAMSERGANGFSQPIRIDDPSSLGSSVYSSILLPNEMTLYASVNSVGATQSEGLAAIARATRESTSALFANWELVESLDGPGWDQPIWLSEDECQIIVRQDAEDAGVAPTEASDIFIARRGL